MRYKLIDGDLAKKPDTIVDFLVNVRLQAIHIRSLKLVRALNLEVATQHLET